MKIKKILIFCLILCFIFSLQAVVAADADLDGTHNELATVDHVANETGDVSSVDVPDTEVIGAGEDSFTDLAGKIIDGGTVHLDTNYKYDSGSDNDYKNGIHITKDLTLIGDGTTYIDGDNQARIFDIDLGVTVTLQGITFTNGYSTGSSPTIPLTSIMMMILVTVVQYI